MNDIDPSPETRPARPTKTVPEAEEVSALARHGDPSQAKTTDSKTEEKAKRGIVWVHPSELMSQTTARVAGRGIDFQAELSRRTRRLPGEATRGTRRGIRSTGERARRLPPVTAFGLREQSSTGATRSGIGLR